MKQTRGMCFVLEEEREPGPRGEEDEESGEKGNKEAK